MTPINGNCSLFSTSFQGTFHFFIAFPRMKGTNYCNLTSGHPHVLLPCVLFQTLSEIMVIAFSVCTSPTANRFTAPTLAGISAFIIRLFEAGRLKLAEYVHIFICEWSRVRRDV